MSNINYIDDDALENTGEQASIGKSPAFMQIWRSILNNRLAIGLILSASVALGIIYTILSVPYYSATSRIEINRVQDKVTNVEGLEAEDAGQNFEFYQTQYALLEARSVAERVVSALGLAMDDEFFSNFSVDFSSSERASSHRSSGTSEARRKAAVDILLSNISISPIRGSSLVDISFQSPDAAFSAKVANAWVEQFIEATMDRKFVSTADARKFLEGRLRDLKQRLEESERQLVQYAASKEIIAISTSRDDEGRVTNEQTVASSDLEALNRALSSAIAARIAAESQANRAVSSGDGILSDSISGIVQQRAAVAAEHAKLLSQFEPGYPAVVALSSQLKELDSIIRDEERRVYLTAHNKYRAALQEEKNLRLRVGALKQRFLKQRSDTIQYNIYQREVDTNRQLYDGLLQRYKEIGVAGVGSNNITVVDPAREPERPSKPILSLNIAFSVLLGFLLAGIYIVVVEQIDQSVKDPADIKKFFGVEQLGVLPNSNQPDLLSELYDLKSAISEAYFSVLTSLSFSTEFGVPKSFAVSSTRQDEGKSTSALALAILLARSGKKVLMIDGDMRNPSLHRFLEIKNNVGLASYLAGHENLEELIFPSQTSENLSAMSAGPRPPNPAQLLAGSKMTDLISQLLPSYDHIIVDAPPVMGFADVPLIGRTVEGMVFVVEANGPMARDIAAALKRIKEGSVRVFGAMLTKLDDRNKEYGYNFNYKYGDEERIE